MFGAWRKYYQNWQEGEVITADRLNELDDIVYKIYGTNYGINDEPLTEEEFHDMPGRFLASSSGDINIVFRSAEELEFDSEVVLQLIGLQNSKDVTNLEYYSYLGKGTSLNFNYYILIFIDSDGDLTFAEIPEKIFFKHNGVQKATTNLSPGLPLTTTFSFAETLGCEITLISDNVKLFYKLTDENNFAHFYYNLIIENEEITDTVTVSIIHGGLNLSSGVSTIYSTRTGNISFTSPTGR